MISRCSLDSATVTRNLVMSVQVGEEIREKLRQKREWECG